MKDLIEILRNVPRGTKLYSTLHGDIYFDHIDVTHIYPIKCYGNSSRFYFTKDGKNYHDYDGECVLFPSKKQRDWSKFCQLKIGDIIYDESNNIISIYNCDDLRFDVAYYVQEKLFYISDNLKKSLVRINISNCRIATSTEKELFYNKLQEEGYFWNGETKSLEKYKFEVGHCITTTGKHKHVITQIKHNKYIVTTDDKYLKDEILCAYQENFNFYQEKFDITTLKPYDKVLTRRSSNSIWIPQLFSCLDSDLKDYCNKFVVVGDCSVKHCIPYEGNEHLIGTNNECDEYYKTWE